MGKQVSLIQFTGKVGEVYGAVDPLTGGVAIRKMPVRKDTKATESQILQRVKFGTLTSLASCFGKGLAGLAQYAKSKKMRARNAFVALNKDKVEAAQSGDSVSPVIALDELILSKGNANNVDFGQPDFSERNNVAVSFEATTGAVSDNARVVAVVYQADLGEAVSAEGYAQAGSVTVPIPRGWSGMRVHVYGYTIDFTEAADAEKFDALYETNRGATNAEIIRAAASTQTSNTTYIGSGNAS